MRCGGGSTSSRLTGRCTGGERSGAGTGMMVAGRGAGVRACGFGAWVIGNLFWVVYGAVSGNVYVVVMFGFYWVMAVVGE